MKEGRCWLEVVLDAESGIFYGGDFEVEGPLKVELGKFVVDEVDSPCGEGPKFVAFDVKFF